MADRTYAERMRALNLESLEERRIRTDLITAYKIQFGHYKVDRSKLFESNNYTATRSHGHKEVVPFARSDVRKNSFAVRTSKLWNDLPADKVDFTSLKNFVCTLSNIDFSKYCAGL